MLPRRSQRPAKPIQLYDPPPPTRKRALTTASIAPSVNKKPCSNAPAPSTQARVAAEALQQLFCGAQGEGNDVEDEIDISTGSEEEEEDEDSLLSPPRIPSPSQEPDTFSYIWQAV